MPVSLSIKNVPEDLAERLRERAKRNHRSLQGELLAILEHASTESAANTPLTIGELHRRVQASGLRTPATSAAFIREDRDAP
jgi:plasmid stability protein